MANFTFSCPQCGQHLEAQDEWRGEETQCPSCGTVLTIPKKITLTPVSVPTSEEKDGILLKRGKFLGPNHEQTVSILCPHCEKTIRGGHLDVFAEELECPYCKGKITYSAVASPNNPIVIIQNETQQGQHIPLTAYGITDTEIYEAFRVFILRSHGKLLPRTNEYQWAIIKGAPYGINAYASKNQNTAVNLHMDAMNMSMMRVLGDIPNVYDVYPGLIETIWGIKNSPGFGNVNTSTLQQSVLNINWLRSCIIIGLCSYLAAFIFSVGRVYIMAWLSGTVGTFAFIAAFMIILVNALIHVK